MFKRLTTSLTKPPRLVFFMKDSWKRVVLYLLLLPLVLVVPSIIRFAIQPGMSVSQYNALSDILKSDFNLDGEAITDGVFQTTISDTATFDYFQISTTRDSLNPYMMTFLFDSQDLVLYVGTMPFESMSYVELGIDNYTFDLMDSMNLNTLASAIKTLYNTQSLTMYVQIFAEYFIGLADFLMIVLLLALIDYFIIPNQPFSFKLRFKLSAYASTIYVFVELLFILFGLAQLNFISIIIAYTYHIWVYRTVKVIPKGVHTNGNNE